MSSGSRLHLLAAAVVVIAGGACAGQRRAPGQTAGSLGGARTLTLETTVEVTEESGSRETSVLRLGGELAPMAAQAVAETDPERRDERLLEVYENLLGATDFDVLEAPRLLPSGEVELRYSREYERLGGRDELRMLEPPMGLAHLMVAALRPLPGAPALPDPRQPSAWFPPSTVELRYAVTIPEGFVFRGVPPDVGYEKDGVTFQRRFVATGKQQLRGQVRFALAGPRVPGQAVLAVAASLEERQRVQPVIEVELTADALQNGGRLTEALFETRRLLTMRPRSAVFHAKQAGVLLALGMVETARATARKAVALAPDLALAHDTLARTLEHDLLGRPFAAGYDRTAALAARRRHLEVTGPEGRGALELARLLARDERGGWLNDRAPLEEIVKLTHEVADGDEVDAALLEVPALMRLGRAADADSVARERLGEDRFLYWRMATTAQARGLRTALEYLRGSGLDESQRAAQLKLAADRLLHARIYPLAGQMHAEATRLDPKLQNDARLWGQLRRHEMLSPDERQPLGVLHKLISACNDPRAFASLAGRLIDPRGPSPQGPMMDQICPHLVSRSVWPTSDWMIDLALTEPVDVSGDPRTGYRLRRAYRSAAVRPVSTYFTTADGKLRLLGQVPFLAADEALRLATAGAADQAATWLEWLREDLEPITPPMPAPSTLRDVLVPLWGDSGTTASRRGPAPEAAAAVAGHRAGAADRALPILRAAFAAARDPDRRRALARGYLAALLAKGAGAEADRVASRLPAADHDAASIAFLRARAAAAAGDCRRALVIMKQARERAPGNAHLVRQAASVAGDCGEMAEEEAAHRKLVSASAVQHGDYNNLAWLATINGKTAEGVEHARRAVEMSQRRQPASLHTLAHALARHGDLDEARSVLREHLDRQRDGSPITSSWLVIGALAEQLSLPADAQAAYRRIPRPPPPVRASSPWALAQKRLEALGGRSSPPAAKN